MSGVGLFHERNSVRIASDVEKTGIETAKRYLKQFAEKTKNSRSTPRMDTGV